MTKSRANFKFTDYKLSTLHLEYERYMLQNYICFFVYFETRVASTNWPERCCSFWFVRSADVLAYTRSNMTQSLVICDEFVKAPLLIRMRTHLYQTIGQLAERCSKLPVNVGALGGVTGRHLTIEPNLARRRAPVFPWRIHSESMSTSRRVLLTFCPQTPQRGKKMSLSAESASARPALDEGRSPGALTARFLRPSSAR